MDNLWQQHYTPVNGSIGLSALVAAIPLFILLYLLGIRQRPAWQGGVAALFTALAVSLAVYRMPPSLALSAMAYGAAFGLFPIGWIVFWAILLYRITVDTGQFEIIKGSISRLTRDPHLQTLLVGFAFGAFLEGAAGFGTPVAISAAMLAGLGVAPFQAAALCLLANTAPVAFGSIGIPIFTLAVVTGLAPKALSPSIGRLCAPISLFIPAYLMLVAGGWGALRSTYPAALACGIAFASTQFFVSNYIGPQLTDILSSLASVAALIIVIRLTRREPPSPGAHTTAQVLRAWSPYGLLVICVLLWGQEAVKAKLDLATRVLHWPGLYGAIAQAPPVSAKVAPYAANYTMNFLSASGTSCMVAAFASALVLGIGWAGFGRVLKTTVQQLFVPILTIATVLALAFLMNYSGATATLGLAFAATGAAFPFFSALLGWVGVFLTGSDTSANALFGTLQVVTARSLSFPAVLMAATNSSGGVMGKMISLQSIAVAAAATGMPASDQGKLFRFTFRHSLFLASCIGLLALLYAYAGR